MMSAPHSESQKPLQVNPFKVSQPMGAVLAFLGVKGCMPLVHGAQGCANFTKVFFTRHFCEPIALQNTAVSDITAVLDGGGKGIAEAVETIAKKVSPELIGLLSTGLTETKGDDIRAASDAIKGLSVYVNTPDYEGGMESGFGKTVKAIVEQLVEERDFVNETKALILPHVSMTPIELEKIKEFVERFGYEVHALPDLSTSLDGYLGEKQGSLSSGGITVEEIKKLACSGLVISIGESMKPAAQALLAKNEKIRHLHFNSICGLRDTDDFVEKLIAIRGPNNLSKVKRWRARLQDMMLDSHFRIGKTRFIITGEPDQLVGLSRMISEVGGTVSHALSTVDSPALEFIEAEKISVGDFEDVINDIDNCNALISNFHAERIAHKYHKPLIVRGFPNWEQVGNQLTFDSLYEGGAYFLKEVANSLTAIHPTEGH